MSGDDCSWTWDRLVELIGLEAATRLSEARGGRNVYVAPDPGRNSPLVQIVGIEAARKLAAPLVTGETIVVPSGPGKRARIRALRQAGRTIDQIAAEERCTRRHVFYVLAESPSEPPLLALLAAP